MRRIGWVVVLLVGLGAGCTRATARLPKIADVDPTEGFKLLRPGAVMRECRVRGLWPSDASIESDLATIALRRLLETDDEATAVTNARIEWTSWTLGIYGEHCVSLTGDVVRSVRTILLPMPGHDGDHSDHHERH